MLLSFMNKQQGMFSFTAIDFGVIRKYFIFLVSPTFWATRSWPYGVGLDSYNHLAAIALRIQLVNKLGLQFPGAYTLNELRTSGVACSGEEPLVPSLALKVTGNPSTV